MDEALTLDANQAIAYGLAHELTTMLVAPGVEVIGIR